MSVIRTEAFLCDAIESVNGKLYAIGIGWNMIQAPEFPAQHGRIGIGIVVHVPYTATNQMHEFLVHLESEDGVLIPLADAGPGVDPRTVEDGKVVRVGGQFNVGRPPELPAGDEQVVTMGFQMDGVVFPAPGSYAVVVSIDTSEEARLQFRLRQPSGMQIQMPR